MLSPSDEKLIITEHIHPIPLPAQHGLQIGCDSHSLRPELVPWSRSIKGPKEKGSLACPRDCFEGEDPFFPDPQAISLWLLQLGLLGSLGLTVQEA